MVAVLGLSESSRADLQTQIGKLGTNLLTVQAGSGFGAGDATLPVDVTTAIARIGPIENVTGVVTLSDPVLRNSEVNADATGGVQAVAADLNLLATLNSSVAEGVWLNAATSDYPAVVLGATAAQRLGVTTAGDGQQILIGGKRFTVVGILNPFPLAADLDRSAIIGTKAAVDYLGSHPRAQHGLRHDRARVRLGRPVRAGGDGQPRAPRGGRGHSPVRRLRGAEARPTTRSPRCSSALARWRCSWEASASPTS